MDRQYEWQNSCNTGAYFTYHASQPATKKMMLTTGIQRGSHLSKRLVGVELRHIYSAYTREERKKYLNKTSGTVSGQSF
jgi:hypothetical protein